MLEDFFKLKEHGTTVKVEVMAGVVTFMTMAYIIFVNPSILSAAGMPVGAVMTATCISAAIGTLLMGLIANYPFALAPGMGLNAFFAYSVVLGMGLSWQAALAAVFISGIIFLLLTVSRIREQIVNAIPMSLKLAVSVGIGLFIAFIGLKNMGLIVPDSATFLTLVGPEYFHDPDLKKLLPAGVTVPSIMVGVGGLIITSALVARKVKGSLLWAILLTTILGIPFGVTNLENFTLVSLPPSLGETFGAFTLGFKEVFNYGIISIVFAFTFVDLFDTIGTLVGVSSKAGMLDEKGHLPKVNKALLADSLGTMFGAVLGTSTVTTYVESASGVAEGGRTGLTALVTAVLFLIALFFSPLVGVIPSAATAPVLVIVGVFMAEPVKQINWSNYLDAIPAFLAIIMMPLTSSIAEGIVFGVLAFTALHILTGKFKEISATMWVLTLLFIVRFFLI
ncbi:MAG: NCS2 family permease [Desulfitobacteriaceae bacterium]|nr:NCS2 family permease [Desulfitobacteriaceae bacterium]